MTEKKVVRIFGKDGVPGNYQGWKTPWKLACDFKWVQGGQGALQQAAERALPPPNPNGRWWFG
jgi:hypothetical protein